MTRRITFAVALVAIIVGVVWPLADATQTRPDPVVANSSTVVEFTVATRRYRGGDAAAAAALWAACSATINGRSTAPERGADDVWRVRVSPLVGPHGRLRLRGCLSDVTLDRVRAELIAFRSSGH